MGEVALASVLAKYGATSWASCSKLTSFNNALTAFHNWVAEKNTICDSVVAKLNTIYDDLLQLETNFQIFFSGLNNIQLRTQNMMNLVTNGKTGILDQTNCLFVG